VSTPLLLSGVSLVAGGLLVAYSVVAGRRPALAARLERAGAPVRSRARQGNRLTVDARLGREAEAVGARYERSLRQAGDGKTVVRLLAEKALLAIAFPLVPLLPYAAATGRLPSAGFALALAVVGFFVPDLALRSAVKRRREDIFLDLPEALSVMALALGAGISLRQALELAARDCPGALGEELERALNLARRERGLGEREALVRVARQSGEPTFARFTELLAAKESPYVEFLRNQAAQARAEQNRFLERAADRAYLSMHAPVAPLLAVLVLLVAYGLLRFLAETI
jgi:tight adherence protein C